jgi:hypothetical protein
VDDRHERAGDWIDRVLQAAGDLSAEITPLEAAEALWLLAGFRSQQDANDAIGADSEPSDLDSSNDEIANSDSQDDEDEDDDEDDSADDLAKTEDRSAEAAQGVEERITDVPVGIGQPEHAVGGWKPVGVELSRLPGLSDVRGQRAGLSDLVTYAPDPRRLVLDVQRSIELSCRMLEPFLAVRPGTSPATDVLLLVDGSVTMSPWQKQLERLNKLVRETAGLASWTVLHLDLSGPPRLRAVDTEPAQTVTAENAHESGADTVERWIRPGRRTLVLLWSDGIAAGFMELGGALASLSEDTTVAWLHPWPRHAWRRTAEGRLRLYQPGSRARGRRSIPIVVVPPSRPGWHDVGAMLRGGSPAGFPVLALPPPRAQNQSLVEPARRRRTDDPLPKDEAGWAHYFKRLELHLHRDTLRLIGLLAAFPVERFSFEAAYALAMHAGLDTAGFLLAEALTAGVVKADRVDGTAWYSFQDGAARRTAAVLVDEGDLQKALALHKDQLDHDAIELPVYVRAEGGEHGATATSATVKRREVGASSAPTRASSATNEAASLANLIESGKRRGFVTYEDVNDAMPEHVLSQDQIDSWIATLHQHGIEVVNDRARAASASPESSVLDFIREIERNAKVLGMAVAQIDGPQRLIMLSRDGLETAEIAVHADHLEARIRCRAFGGDASPLQVELGTSFDHWGWFERFWRIESKRDVRRFGSTLASEWRQPVRYQKWLEKQRAKARQDASLAYGLGRALLCAGGIDLFRQADGDHFLVPDDDWITPTVPDEETRRAFLAEGLEWLEQSASEGVTSAAVDLARVGLLACEAQADRPPLRSNLRRDVRDHLDRLAVTLPPSLNEANVLLWASDPDAMRDVRVVRRRARLFAAGRFHSSPERVVAELRAAADTGSTGARWAWAKLVLDLADSHRLSLAEQPAAYPLGLLEPAASLPGKDDVDRAVGTLRELCGAAEFGRTSVALAFANRMIEGVGVFDHEAEGWALLASLPGEDAPSVKLSERDSVVAVQVCRILRTLFPQQPDPEARALQTAFAALQERARVALRGEGRFSEQAGSGGELLLRGYQVAERAVTWVIRNGPQTGDFVPALASLLGPREWSIQDPRLPSDVAAHLQSFMQLRNQTVHSPSGAPVPSVAEARRAIDTHLAPFLEWALRRETQDWESDRRPARTGLSPAQALETLRGWKDSLVTEAPDERATLVQRTLRTIATANAIELGLLRIAADRPWPHHWETSWTSRARMLASIGVTTKDVERLRDLLGLSADWAEGDVPEETPVPGTEPRREPTSAPPRTKVDDRSRQKTALPRKNPDMSLPKRLQPALRLLEKDLLERAKLPGVEAGLRAAWETEKKAGETGQGFDPWRRARVTQIAVAWVLSVVFVRTLEDRRLIDPRIAGPDAADMASARDREATFVQIAPFLGPREYLLAVFREITQLPGAREVFDTRHNPVWVLAPSSEGARSLLDFFQAVDSTTGAPVITFAGSDTRFLGDLYQDLSESVRKRYALLQTPDFVEKFILEQTLKPAIEEFGLAEVKIIDPTCGSGHFLLGAFRDLLAAWQRKEPTKPIEELASRALGQVYGVDINPYAVAIARFRLVLAVLDAVGIRRLDKAPTIRPKVVAADSLLHRLRPTEQLRLTQQKQISFEEYASWGDALFRLAEPGAVAEVLGQRYHAVVGNPPYITEQDATKRNKYREMYKSAAGKYALAAPFTERFFELAVTDGFVGMINSNAWTKRDYGKTLIEKVLPHLDVQKIIDTAGCYLPGHGTPTLLLFGRNRAGNASPVVAVLGKRGEHEVPSDPSSAPVWSEIIRAHDDLGFNGDYVSTESVSEQELRSHPWVLAGGGARVLLDRIRSTLDQRMGELVDSIGFMVVTGCDDALVRPMRNWEVAGVGRAWLRVRYTGISIRDWDLESTLGIAFPYGSGELAAASALDRQLVRSLWPTRTTLLDRPDFGGKRYRDVGRTYYEFHQVPLERLRRPQHIAFSCVSTHNNFAIGRAGSVFDRHAPIITLTHQHDESDHQSLLGYMNSSTVAFWCRLVMFPKGGDQVGDGARLSATQWNRHLEYAGNLLQQLPVPKLEELRDALLEPVAAAEETVAKMSNLAPEKVVGESLVGTPSLAGLNEARSQYLTERARLRAILVSLQEEMDWRVYGLLGLPTVTAPSVDAVRVPVAPNDRPFEVRLAREIESDVSASEWFRIHRREAPADVGGPLADLYRQRLRLLDDPERGRQLRLLETPETKRRWSPADDYQAFTDAVRTWLLERIETVFREQSTPQLRTARQLVLDLGRDPAVQVAHEVLTAATGFDLVRLVSDLVDDEGVPFLAGFRYTVTGMEKRVSWEETWRLQRLEDAGQLAPELKRLGLTSIPVPDKYANKDFQRQYWRLRGKLDVPKERFMTVPGGNTDDDPTPLVGWAGWDHLQAAQALAALYQRRKTEDGWTSQRLVPLLAGLAERVPWLLQWHDQPSDAYGGVKLGEFFRDFVAGEAHTLGVAVDFTKATDDLRAWTPPQAVARKTLEPDELYAALRSWKPEVSDDDDDDEDVEPPAGPTADDLIGAVGASKTLVNAVLKKLVADGRVEKLDGRPARYVATGDDE